MKYCHLVLYTKCSVEVIYHSLTVLVARWYRNDGQINRNILMPSLNFTGNRQTKRNISTPSICSKFSTIYILLYVQLPCRIICIGTTKCSHVEIYSFWHLCFSLEQSTISSMYIFFASSWFFWWLEDRPTGIFRRPPLRTGGKQAKRNISTPDTNFISLPRATCKKFEHQNYALWMECVEIFLLVSKNDHYFWLRHQQQ